MASSLRHSVVAEENDRSMHKGLVPRFGGIGIVFGVTLGWLILGIDSWWLLLSLGLCIAFVSFMDDAFTLPVWIRLSTQLVMATVFAFVEFGFDNRWLLALLIFAIVWMLNLFNFMDGLDGLAGGMAVFGYATFGLAAFFVASDVLMLKAAMVVVAATLAFLRWNLIPQKLFLGDVGSTTLGFMAAAFSFYGWREAMWPVWFPIIVFLPFIADATVTILKRLVNRENIFKAHKKHYYQRLTQMGMTQAQVRKMWYGAMLICSLVGLALLRAGDTTQLIGLLIMSVMVATVFVIVDLKWQNYKKLQNAQRLNLAKQSENEEQDSYNDQKDNEFVPIPTLSYASSTQSMGVSKS